MDRIFESFWFYLWGMVLVFCLALAELGRLAGFIPPAVLNDLTGGPWWWDRPGFLHFILLAVSLVALILLGSRFLRKAPALSTGYEKAVAVLVIILGIFLCVNQYGELENVVSRTTDFGTIYRASKALAAGDNPYQATSNQYFYPPLPAFLFIPLTLLPLSAASTLFFSIKFIMIAWTLKVCYRLVSGYDFTGGRRALFIFGLIFVAARFWVSDLQFGNTNVVILYLIVASILLDRKDRSMAAGMALALAAAIKIVPAVLCLHFIITGRWRTVIYFSVFLVAFNLFPWLFLAGHWSLTWEAYLDAGVAGKLGERLAKTDNQSFWGTINRSFSDVPLEILRWLWVSTSLLLAAFVAFISSRSRSGGKLTRIAAVSLYPLLGLMVSPGSWVVHYTAVLPAMAVLWKICLVNSKSTRWLWIIFAFTNLVYSVSGIHRALVNISIDQSWFVIATVTLIAALGAWVLRNQRAAAAWAAES